MFRNLAFFTTSTTAHSSLLFDGRTVLLVLVSVRLPTRGAAVTHGLATGAYLRGLLATNMTSSILRTSLVAVAAMFLASEDSFTVLLTSLPCAVHQLRHHTLAGRHGSTFFGHPQA